MRKTTKLENIELSQNDEGEYFLCVTLDSSDAYIALAGAFPDSDRQKIVNAWAEEQLQKAGQ